MDEGRWDELDDGGVRLHGVGGAVVLRPPGPGGLRTLSLEGPDGQLLHSVVLDEVDARTLVNALDAARLEMRCTGESVSLDLRRLLDRG